MRLEHSELFMVEPVLAAARALVPHAGECPLRAGQRVFVDASTPVVNGCVYVCTEDGLEGLVPAQGLLALEKASGLMLAR